MSLLSEAHAPPASATQITLTRVAAVALVGWLCVIAALSWMAYDEGYIDVPLPLWNSFFVVGTIPLVAGIFSRRLWAQRWVLGIALFTGIGNVMQASKADSTLLWVGAVALGGIALVMIKTKPIFRYDNAHRGTFAQLVATVITVGSLVMLFGVSQKQGTERGRKAFAAEVQKGYVDAGITSVRVYIEERTLVIEAPSDTNEQIDQAADMLRAQLVQAGANAKAWVLGFQTLKVTNGTHSRLLAPP